MCFNRITNTINIFCEKFLNHPNILLTEEDMRLQLGAMLLKHFNTLKKTQDDNFSISLHSEVRWYGNGQLKYRTDLVIIDVSTLNVSRFGKFPLSSKGYAFDIPKAIIELKFRRPNGPSNKFFIKSLIDDCEKLGKISSEI